MPRNEPLAALALGSLGHGGAPVAGVSTRRSTVSFLAALAAMALAACAAACVLAPQSANLCQAAPGTNHAAKPASKKLQHKRAPYTRTHAQGVAA